jgi:hypothetical protein
VRWRKGAKSYYFRTPGTSRLLARFSVLLESKLFDNLRHIIFHHLRDTPIIYH